MIKASTTVLVLGLVISLLIVGTGEAVKVSYKPTESNLSGIYSSSLINTTELKDLINYDRNLIGLAPLKVNKQLNNSATAKCTDMVVENYFGHNSPDGSPFYKIIEGSGLRQYTSLGENLAIGQSDAASVNLDWMNSEGHRDNILSQNYSDMGVAVCKTNKLTSSMLITVLQFASF